MSSFSCLDCNRYFNSSQGLESHCDAKYHDGLWECCNKRFYSWYAWDQVGSGCPSAPTVMLTVPKAHGICSIPYTSMGVLRKNLLVGG